MKAVRVVVVGDVALDVLVTPATVPVAGADVPARIRTRPGGAGANTAAWLAHLGRGAGIAVTLTARVGADPPGRAAAADLAAAGVTAHLTVDPQAATCTVVSLLGPPAATSHHPTPGDLTAPDVTWPDATPSGAGPVPPSAAAGGPGAPLVGVGDRTLLSDRGAAALLDPDDLPDVAGFDHLHLSGYVLLDASSRAAGRAALAAARAAGITTSVDPQAAPALAAPGGAAVFLDDVRGVDLLLPNTDELRALGGQSAVLRHVGAVAVSAGADGARWADPTVRCHAPAPPVSVVDATGAGDAFDAGVLVARLTGASPAEALAAGCAAGAAAVGRLGARP
ncbi:MAG TPA: PfkB family carbohydrate kinase [Pseudonocardia sp.]|nr:PfkB family carbohydrate kinase [Pseudonocardia sp.]